MAQNCNFDRVMEARDHFKNGVSSKSLTSRGNNNKRNMKKVVLVFLLFRFILNVDTYGQNAVQKFFHGEFYDGFIVLLNGDTIKGKIPFRDTYENYYQVSIKSTTSNELAIYRPKEVLVYSVDSLYLYPKTFIKNRLVFMRLLFEDHLKIYLHRNQVNTGTAIINETQFRLEKPDGQNVLIKYHKRFNLKKYAGDFFKDCPHISEKINNKTYKAVDILKIAYEYNEWLKQN